MPNTDFPRPQADYYEERHEFLTQGDILRDVPWSQLGPAIIVIDPPPEGRPVPEGTIPILVYGAVSPFAMVLSDTCDFRHPAASKIHAHPLDYMQPGSVYHSGFVRIAPIFPLSYFEDVPKDEKSLEELRRLDHFRKIMYLPSLSAAGLGESAVAFYMSDSLSIDLLLHQERVTQLTYVARQQLNHKLTYTDTGFRVPYDQFDPDLE